MHEAEEIISLLFILQSCCTHRQTKIWSRNNRL